MLEPWPTPGKANQGAEILQKLIQARPSNLDLYVNLSQIYLQAKRYSDAEKILRRAQGLESLKEPDGERLKFQLAAVYERQKEFDRAESLFKEVIKSNPDNASALNYIGYMLADRGVRLDEAVEYVEKALALDPNNGAYLDSLGWALFKLNDLAQAEKYLLKAVSIVKNDPTIHDHLGDLYYKTGDYEKAQEFWTKSLSTRHRSRTKSRRSEKKSRSSRKHCANRSAASDTLPHPGSLLCQSESGPGRPGKRPDGYHEIRTVIQAIDLCDELELRPSAKLSLDCEDWIHFRRSRIWSGNPPSLCHAPRASVRSRDLLRKRIPAGAGLGGGSSNAAAALLGLCRLWQLHLPAQELHADSRRAGI